MMRPDIPDIIEGFAVKTNEGLIFTVKGGLHPPDRVIAYLRYLPDPTGERHQAGLNYRRLYHFQEQQRLLESRYLVYLHNDPVFGIQLQAVPRSRICRVYDPRRHLAVLRRQKAVDKAEAYTVQLANLLQAESGIAANSLGITGSVLLELHQPNSDIDLIVYGEAAGRAVYQTLNRLLDGSTGAVRRPNSNELASLHQMHQADTPLTLTDFTRLQLRKVNEGYFKEHPYFIRFVKWADDTPKALAVNQEAGAIPFETDTQYGACHFEQSGAATIQACVVDDSDSIFTPCRYRVNQVRFLAGPPVNNLLEVVSFRGRFSEQARLGESIIACGNLERVVRNNGQTFHRLIVGGRAGDYLLAEN